MKEVPAGAQNFWEWLVESLYDFLEGIIGSDAGEENVLVLCDDFHLHPVHELVRVDSRRRHDRLGRQISGARIRSDAAAAARRQCGPEHDVRHGDAILLLSGLIWALQANGVKGIYLHIFGPKGDTTGVVKFLMIVVFFWSAFWKCFPSVSGPISLSFRLYGNIFAGENMLEAMSNVIQHPAWAKALFSALLPVPFYFMELLVGMVQALVFMLLSAVFTVLICMHEEEPGKDASLDLRISAV